MKHEFHAQYSLALQPDFAQQEAVNYLTDAPKQPPKHWDDLGDVTDPAARIRLLAQAILTPYKDYARVGTHRTQGGLLHAINLKIPDRFFEQQSEGFLAPLKLDPTLPDITLFPRGSWAISFKFKLQKPYLSKDDTDFYILDNPVRKEWVFQVPYIAPSQWKGALRAAMVRQLVEESGSLSDEEFAILRFRLTLLFGDEKGEEPGVIKDLAKYLDGAKSTEASHRYRQEVRKHFPTKDDESESFPHHAGNLHFYTTYFTKISMEVINPHDRETGAGTLPIYFESVPAGADGVFTLLYVPVDCIGIKDDAETEKQSAEMLCLVAEGVEAMLAEYGFGAKTSSGFGTAGDGVEDGRVVSNAEWANDLPEPEVAAPEPPDEKYLKYLDDSMVRVDVRGDDGKPMRIAEYGRRVHEGRNPVDGGSQSEYRKFMRWYVAHGKAWQKNHQRDAAPAESPGWGFKSLNGLVKQTQELVKKLKKMEGSD
ncbi:MAG: hypothetical protein C4B59_10680 [Candidatus Methanogaster sp.]|uniref:Uncharacterized protein n=1 Tax=Candidatus Methanogaster sp. TaxID=3386292 RepID=A0AC61L1A9_9EURY|nr:MAG: hypothetical protein C4B59_10680 [ANME-2 cluster archaeon]